MHQVRDGELDPHVGVGDGSGDGPGRLHGGAGQRLVPDDHGVGAGCGDGLGGGLDDAAVAAGVAGEDDVLATLDEHDLLDELAGGQGEFEAEVLGARFEPAVHVHGVVLLAMRVVLSGAVVRDAVRGWWGAGSRGPGAPWHQVLRIWAESPSELPAISPAPTRFSSSSAAGPRSLR